MSARIRLVLTRLPQAKRVSRNRRPDLPMPLILLIDDDADMHTLVEAMLKPAGHNVVGARTALRGLELALSGNPDVILLDLNMPEMNGFTALHRLKGDEKTAETPVLVLTAVREKEAIVRAMRLGASGYIAKPVDQATMIQKVTEAAKAGARDKTYRHSVEMNRTFNQTTISLRNALGRAVAETIPMITDGFLQRTRFDTVVLDVTRLPGVQAPEMPLLDGLIDRLGVERCVILSGRHTGSVMEGSQHAGDVPCFITHGDLEEFLREKDKAAK